MGPQGTEFMAEGTYKSRLHPKSAVLQMKQATRRRSHLDLRPLPMIHSDTEMYIFTRVGELWLRKCA